MGYVPPPNETAPGAMEELQCRYVRVLAMQMALWGGTVLFCLVILLYMLLRPVVPF